MKSIVTWLPALACLTLAMPVAVSSAPTARHHAHHRSSWNRHSIWIDKLHQRLYAFDGQKLVLDAKCSTAAHRKEWVPQDHRSEEVGTPAGDFRIQRKDSNHWSHTWGVHMLYALFFNEGRAIHGTYPSEYKNLGKAASGGCVRLTRSRAEALYRWAHVGDHVHVVHNLPHAWSALVHRARSGSVLLHKK